MVSNFFVYGLGGIISKAIPLVMVPIITRMMPNSFYYGISDLSSTIVSLFSALAVMGMYDAMYRMFFEKPEEEYKKDICSSALFFTLLTSIAVAAVMFALQRPISQLFYSDSSYGNLVMLCAMSVLIGSTNSIISAPTRMQNKRAIYLIANSLSPVISYSLAIPLLLSGHYLIALPLSTLISACSMEIIFYLLNRKWFSFKRINWKYIKSMLCIALPLLPNFIIYWIFNSSDRVMISNILGADCSGIYAVAAKIGNVSQLIYLAFAGGWQFFAFSIMRDKDNIKVISKVLEILSVISFAATLVVSSVCKIGVELLFSRDYWGSYLCVPYLFISPLLLMLFQIGSNQFLVVKKTWPNLIILSSGALINIALNLVLIPNMGIEGASIATLTGYIVSVVLCIIVLLRFKLLKIKPALLLNFILFLLCFGIMRFNAFAIYYVNVPVALVFLCANIFFYRKDMKLFIGRLFSKKKSKGSELADSVDGSSEESPQNELVGMNSDSQSLGDEDNENRN